MRLEARSPRGLLAFSYSQPTSARSYNPVVTVHPAPHHPPRGAHVSDDRGQARPLAAAQSMTSAGLSGEDPELVELRVRAWQSVSSDVPSRKRMPLRIFIWGVAVGLAVVLGAVVPGLPPWIMPVVMMGAFVAGMFVYTRRQARKNAPRLVEVYLASGRCPCCEYSLEGAVAEPDGCVVCPECGGAWKGSRVRTGVSVPTALREHRRRLVKPGRGDRLTMTGRRLLIVQDARGHAAYVINPRLRRLDEATIERLTPARIAAVRQMPCGRWRGLLIAPAMLIGLVGVSRFIIAPKPTGMNIGTVFSMVAFAFWCLVAVTIVLGLISMVFGDSAVSPRAACEANLTHGICPQCLELLDGCVPDAQGVVICPGCAAAWKRPTNLTPPLSAGAPTDERGP